MLSNSLSCENISSPLLATSLSHHFWRENHSLHEAEVSESLTSRSKTTHISVHFQAYVKNCCQSRYQLRRPGGRVTWAGLTQAHAAIPPGTLALLGLCREKERWQNLGSATQNTLEPRGALFGSSGGVLGLRAMVGRRCALMRPCRQGQRLYQRLARRISRCLAHSQ